MTKLYKPQVNTTLSYLRAKLITIHNNLNQSPRLTIVEEKVTLEEDVVKKMEPAGNITKDFKQEDTNKSFDILNPATGDVIGSMTYGTLYAAIYSLYFHLVDERDNPVPVVVES